MITTDSILTVDLTCWTADGRNGCDQVSGGGARRDAYLHGLIKATAARTIKGKLAELRREDINDILSARVIEEVSETVIEALEEAPTKRVEAVYQIDHAETAEKVREYVEAYLQRIWDEEIALLLILANI